ncbi:MAG: hypothetical protein H6Q69_4587 [Firmicutes bacterium]|nr:hypothetical protein [Bacillota bacterium]
MSGVRPHEKEEDFQINAVAKRGYSKVYEEHDFIFDFQNELTYKLPEGFHIEKESEVDSALLPSSRNTWQVVLSACKILRLIRHSCYRD